MDIKTVKMDLRRIKYGRKNVIALQSELEKRKSHLEYLKSCRPTKDNRERIAALERTIEVRVSEINRKQEDIDRLQNSYLVAIDSLSELDRVIIMQGYIEGVSYKTLGAKLGYSERGIQERIVRILDEYTFVMTINEKKGL